MTGGTAAGAVLSARGTRLNRRGRETRRQQHDRRSRRPEEGVVEGQLAHLVVSDLRQLFTPVTDVHAPQSRHAIEQLVAVRIVDAAAVRTRNDPAAAELLHQAIVLLCRQVMRQVKAPLTGVIFALEVPYRSDFTRRALLPSLVAAGSAYVTYVAIIGTAPLLSTGGGAPLSL